MFHSILCRTNLAHYLLNINRKVKQSQSPNKRSKKKKKKRHDQNTYPPLDSTTKATIGKDDEGDFIALNDQAVPHKTHPIRDCSSHGNQIHYHLDLRVYRLLCFLWCTKQMLVDGLLWVLGFSFFLFFFKLMGFWPRRQPWVGAEKFFLLWHWRWFWNVVGVENFAMHYRGWYLVIFFWVYRSRSWWLTRMNLVVAVYFDGGAMIFFFFFGGLEHELGDWGI